MLKSKKPDRLVTLVEKAIAQYTIPTDFNKAIGYYLPDHIILSLLRREQRAQRARVVRIVKDELARVSKVEIVSKAGQLWITAKQDVLKDILAKLHGGTP